MEQLRLPVWIRKASIRLAELAEGIVGTDEEGNIPVAVVVHNVYDPNFQIDIINMLGKQLPILWGWSIRGCFGAAITAVKRLKQSIAGFPVDTPYSEQ